MEKPKHKRLQLFTKGLREEFNWSHFSKVLATSNSLRILQELQMLTKSENEAMKLKWKSSS